MAGYYLIGDIIMSASKIIEELGGQLLDVIPSLSKEKKIMAIISSRQAFASEVRSILEAVIDFRDSKISGKYHLLIQKAKHYIDRHFADPDISLHSVANEVNMSPNHFSTIFSQGKGETFIEYLTSVRLERSKELLATTEMKSADIGYEVGFGDPHYFSFIFKKNMGLSPREFRIKSKNRS
jgi:two-component system response regulator YesN